MRVGGDDRLEDLVGAEVRGVHAVHRERGVSVGHLVRDGLDEGVPVGDRLVPRGEAALALVLGADKVVRDGLGQGGRQCNAEASAECTVVGHAAGEIALHHDRDAGRKVAPYLVGRGEQRGQVKAHPCLDIPPLVHLMPQGLEDGWHGGDEDGPAGLGQHRGDGRLTGAP